MSKENQDATLQNVLTESDLMDLLGMKKEQLARLRGKGLPFIKLTDRNRLYFEQDIIDFFFKSRIVLNGGLD